MSADTPEPEAKPPHSALALVLIPVVLGVTALVRRVDPSAHIQPALVYSFAAGSASLVGVPLLVWSFENLRIRPAQLAKLGALAGFVPLLLVLVSGIMGRFIWGGADVEYVGWFLGIGAPIPLVGAVPWPRFLLDVLECVGIGAASAALIGLVVRPRR